MNRFFLKHPKTGIISILFCAIALLADAGNVTDWFPGCFTIHFEEGDGISAEAQVASSVLGATPSLGLYAASRHQHVSPSMPPVFRRIVFDQDSPSLEAVSVQHATFWTRTPDDKQLPPYRVFLSSSLYIEHCALLI